MRTTGTAKKSVGVPTMIPPAKDEETGRDYSARGRGAPAGGAKGSRAVVKGREREREGPAAVATAAAARGS